MATADENRQLARDGFAAVLSRGEAWWTAHTDPVVRRHDPGLPFEVRGQEGVMRLADALCPGLLELGVSAI